MVEIRPDVLRVIDVAVVAFAVVFPNEFPVGGDFVIDNLRLGHSLRRENRSHHCPCGREVRRFFRETHEEHPLQILQVRGQQIEFVVIDFVHPAARGECAIAFVRPLMIRTNQPPRLAAVRATDKRAPMSANIMQCANDAIVTTNNYQRITPNRNRKKFPRFNNLTRVPYKHPLPPKNPFHIRHVHRSVRVKFLRHRMPFKARGNQVVEAQRSV